VISDRVWREPEQRTEVDVGLTGMAFGVVFLAVGGVLYWAEAQSSGFQLSTISLILVVIGAVGLCASTIVFVAARRSVDNLEPRFDRAVADAHGQ
jgi:hypothetical protein